MKKIDRRKISEMCVTASHTVRQTMVVIGQGEIGTAFLVEAGTQRFLGLITDGDIRRAILKGANLDAAIGTVDRPKSKAASIDMKPEEITKMFGDQVRVMPILDHDGKIADIALYDQRLRLPVAEPLLAQKELAYVTDCIVTNWISSTGKYVNQFETLFAGFCNCRHAVATSNGTTALHLALVALGIGPGDEVIVPSLSFIATANAVTYTGAKAVFVDSEKHTWNIDPHLIEKTVTPKTRAIIPVHLYGHPADMDPILAIARRHKLFVIEDAAEAHGAEYKGKKVGSLGDMGVFSFYGNKIITTGEGGMITVNDAALTEKIRILRDHGMSTTRRYWHPVLGFNYRMTNIQAAIGVAQVERIDSILQAKLEITRLYHGQLKGIPGLVLPPQASWAKNVYWLYSLVVEKEFGLSRDDLMKELSALQIDSRPFFPPIHQQPIYNTGQKLEVCEELSRQGLSLPSSAGLQAHEVARVCTAIRKFSG
jgi:perosamine synthetase